MPNSGQRGGAQTAADLAQKLKALVNILRGLAAGGLHGAAVAAVKEALPFLVKLALGVIIFLVVSSMVVFSAIPNIFFGFDSATSGSVADMTQKASVIGGAYMNLEDYRKSQMDSIVTRLVSDYEDQGVTIDKIVVKSEFTKDDLYWLIAINSVVNNQDLDLMSVESIQSLSISRLSESSSLFSGDNGTTLTVDFAAFDPYEMMSQLGFGDEQKNWAETLHKTLSDSDALEKYGSYFTGNTPSYGGDSYGGGVEYGGSGGTDIDISEFTSPGTKNNLDLAAYAIQAWKGGWGYVWGTFGNVLTDALFEYKLEQYPDGVGNYEDFIRNNWLGKRTADCIGLVKGYGWLDTETMEIDYGSNGMPDYGANQMYSSATVSGTMDTMPEIVGLGLWKDGHFGIYIGGGYAIEAMGTKYGVVKTEVAGRGWQGWCEIPSIQYIKEQG
jgi:hypothetical protein